MDNTVYLLRKIEELERRLSRMESMTRGVERVDYNVISSTTPTAAECTAAFGASPSSFFDGWVGLIDDNGSGNRLFLVYQNRGSWFFEALTQAV
jgi:hypothetical protein